MFYLQPKVRAWLLLLAVYSLDHQTAIQKQNTLSGVIWTITLVKHKSKPLPNLLFLL